MTRQGRASSGETYEMKFPSSEAISLEIDDRAPQRPDDRLNQQYRQFCDIGLWASGAFAMTMSIVPALPDVKAYADYWSTLTGVSELQWTRLLGAGEIDRVRRERQDALTAFARTHSPLYRELYRELPADHVAWERFPPVTKRTLMERFDDWVTDPAVRRGHVDAFVADASRIGELFL
jgi:hypothetical protein